MPKRLLEELLTLLFMRLFLPAASGPARDTSAGLIVPWERYMLRALSEVSKELIASCVEMKIVDHTSLREIEKDIAAILGMQGRTVSLHHKTWLGAAMVLQLDDFYRGLIEQILTAYDASYGTPRTSVVVPSFDPKTHSLKPSFEVNPHVTAQEHREGFAPFWRWFEVFVSQWVANHEDGTLGGLEAAFSRLYIPMFPERGGREDGETLELPLPNVISALSRQNRIYPVDQDAKADIRKIAFLDFFGFGYCKLCCLGRHWAIDQQYNDRYQSVAADLDSEAKRLAAVRDVKFRLDHIAASVESITGFQSGSVESVAAMIRRTVSSLDPNADPTSFDAADDVPLGLPQDDYAAFVAKEDGDPSQAADAALSALGGTDTDDQSDTGSDLGNDDAEGADGDTTEGGEDGQEGGEDPSLASPTPAPAPVDAEKDKAFKKLWGKNSIVLDSAPTREGYLYKEAVARLNDTIQNDPGDAISSEVRDQLKFWCRLWLFAADTTSTQNMLRELGLEKYLRL